MGGLLEQLTMLVTVEGGTAAAGEYKKIGTAAEKDLGKAQVAADKTGSSTSKLGDLTTKFGAYAVAGMAAGGAAVAEFAKGAIEDFDSTGMATLNFQRTAGGTAESVSGLLAAGEMLGVSSDSLTAATAKLTIAEGSHKDILDGLGVSLVDNNGHTKDQTQVLQDTLVALSNETDMTKRNTDAKALFGKGYATILPLIAQSGQLEELETQAKKDGLVLSQKQVDAAYANEEAMKKSKAALHGISVEAGGVLAPELTKLITDFTELTQAGNGLATAFGLTGASGSELAIKSNPIVGIFEGISGMITTVTGNAHDYSREVAALSSSQHISLDAAQKWVDEQKALGHEFSDGESLVTAYKASLVHATVANDDFEKSQSDANSELQKAQGELDKAKQKIDDYFKSISGGLDTEAAYQQSVDDLTQAFKDNGATLDVNTQKGRDNLGSVEAVRDAIVKKMQATWDDTKSVDATTQAGDLYVASLEKQMTQAGFTKKQVADYIAQLGLTPSSIATAISTSGLADANANVTVLQQKLDAIDGRLVNVAVLSQFANSVADLKTQVSYGGFHSKRAGGGPVHKGEAYVVGDANRPDPREVFVPSEEGRIEPQAPTGWGGGDGGMLHATIQIDGRTFAEVMTPYTRELVRSLS